MNVILVMMISHIKRGIHNGHVNAAFCVVHQYLHPFNKVLPKTETPECPNYVFFWYCIEGINYMGWLSKSTEVSSGIRQGCPFSPMAFILAVELLAIKNEGRPICQRYIDSKKW